uniref:Cytochrome b6-f complex subunit 6 n=1 Tax=Chaetosphaeridium globosum TaxID=96477 RepID=PETL_CHAGL|nr:cytochrome b6/f complex subunit VI [Chaetosphaeridium globosum]Q8M9Y3.1 RecName: Full=Cytochrome b6-f complex subunit 6; AltName: Full=Cytochrome b6-f complex subunit PetL; AltName: Full=Cytochrome b6-f complex subunit VI [Chaetosphaeridium globosum]AAM96530.1 subunit VI of cytochrome b6/f complex [Chaetosphaeridium globosum]
MISILTYFGILFGILTITVIIFVALNKIQLI